jgi:xanthine dehydrogenase small subunit
MPTRPIRFFHRGAVVETSPAHNTRTVLDWLREDAHCTGTKEGCAEGDCGACMVVVGQLDDAGVLQLRPTNSCIQFVATLDGKALFTVEDVATSPTQLHPVQEALVQCHGSQCGFCTPGFVMSLWASHTTHGLAGKLPSRQELADELSGNLCRCTGYRPILDAAEQAFKTCPPAAALPPQLQAAQAALQTLHSQGAAALQTASGFYAPQTLDELAALRLAQPQATLLAGSTDVGLWVTKQFRPLGNIICLGEVAALREVQRHATHLHIGAGASLQTAWQLLVAEWPSLADVWLRFASAPLRAVGTMGGNVANGSPIGDSAPVLMALGATVVLRRGPVERRVLLDDFYTGYLQNVMAPGEFVQAIEVPRAAAATQLRAYKISKRFDCDISALCAGMSITLGDGHVVAARLAYGGMAATVKRAAQAEAALLGQPWGADGMAAVQAAQAALATDYQPIADLRASAAYRLQVAQNLLHKLWLQTRVDAPLANEQTSVWARP